MEIFKYCDQQPQLLEDNPEKASCGGDVYKLVLLFHILNGYSYPGGILLGGGKICTDHGEHLVQFGQYRKFTIAEKKFAGVIGGDWISEGLPTGPVWAGY